MKRIAVLGSTGSIGTQTLDIVRLHPDKFQVLSLVAGSKVDLLTKQIIEFRPQLVACGSESVLHELKSRVGAHSDHIQFTTDLELAGTLPEVDLVVGGLPGSIGLRPSFAAAQAGKDIALATKEVLVMAGRLFMQVVKESGLKLLPVDSEQSAIFQCLNAGADNQLKRILLTASGGPFRETSMADMSNITPEQALNHPRWKMGRKVTVDSATLMNKGLEVIEAAWLFGVPADKIEVLIHPESIIHSMVEFEDGSIMAQLGVTDMRIPISYALAYPDRIYSGAPPLDFIEFGSLRFEKPDFDKFPLLGAAYDVMKDTSGSAAIIYNAADEVAVDLFLSKKIAFHSIPKLTLDALERIPLQNIKTLEDITALHEEVVQIVKGVYS